MLLRREMGLLLALSVLLTPAAASASSERPVFAFSNESGTRLLALAESGDPSSIRSAVCTDARTYPVKFERVQEESEESDGRAVASNFAFYPGEIFRVVGDPIAVEEDEVLGVTCALMPGPSMSEAELLPLVAPKTRKKCSAGERKTIIAGTGRKLRRCVLLGGLGRRRVLLAEFAPKGKSLLARLVVVDTGKPTHYDFVGEKDPGGMSCWRVEDGCRFPVGAIAVLFGVSTEHGFFLALTWAGPEGENADFLRDEDGRFVSFASAYRYWAP